MILFSLSAIFVACKPPPEAPADLENLSEFLFSHMDDEDPAELQVGLANLDAWLNTGENLEKTKEGYQINNLNDESVADLDDKARTIEETLIGSAVAHSYDHKMSEVIQTMFVDDWSQVTDGMYPCYERIFDDEQNPSCLKDGSCDWASYQTVSVSDWVLVVVVSENSGQIRTVETDYGTAIIQRTWLNKPADTSGMLGDSVDLNAQYYVNIIAPTADGSLLRTAATWFDGQFFVDDPDFAKNQVIKAMQDQNELVTEWIDGAQDSESSCLCSNYDYESKECSVE
jgi:hypothetical protein